MPASRALLPEDQLHPAIRERVAGWHAATVAEAQAAIARHAVVVIGMHQNPFVKKARAALDAAGVAHHDILIGNYFSEWRRRTALKLWTGWPTFPMVFVKGLLVGGADDLNALIASGELKQRLA
ncbi:MAG: glutaredoxin [Rubrivivax sp.]|nr:glutaredoxin [Rubrivivax sp.]